MAHFIVKSLIALTVVSLTLLMCYAMYRAEIWAFNTLFSTSIGHGWKEILALSLLHFFVGLILRTSRRRQP